MTGANDNDGKGADGPVDGKVDGAILDELYAVIESRRGADPAHSRTAALFAKGTAKIAQKVGEESVETLIEAVRGDKALLAQESADLLYHLLVLWADQGVTPSDIWQALAARRETGAMVQPPAGKS